MSAPTDLSWLFTLLGWTVLALGILLLYWSLFSDRAGARRRCPKCWYDMAGIPSLQCPECGRTARTERHLKRTRRRRWWAAAALVLMLAGHLTRLVPVYRERGWVALVPSTALILIAPSHVPPPTPAPIGPLPAWMFTTGGLPPAPPPPPPPLTAPTPGVRLYLETFRRLKARELFTWQSQIYLNRYFSGGLGRSISGVIQFWPREGPAAPVQVWVHNAFAGTLAIDVRLGREEWQEVIAEGDGSYSHALPLAPPNGPNPTASNSASAPRTSPSTTAPSPPPTPAASALRTARGNPRDGVSGRSRRVRPRLPIARAVS